MELYGPGFVWILHYSVREFNKWDKKLSSTQNCTDEQLHIALEYAFVINKMDVRQDEETETASGLVSSKKLNVVEAHLAAHMSVARKFCPFPIQTLKL